MIRNTLLGLAAAATLALTAQAASAGGYGYYGGYGHSYGYSSYHCSRVFVGYRTVWTYYGYVQKPIYKKVCGYGY